MTPITSNKKVRSVVKVQRGGGGRRRGGGSIRSYYCFFCWFFIAALRFGSVSSSSSSSLDGRHSFSLTTFDPNGKLGKVERAIIASSLGTPIIAVILPQQQQQQQQHDNISNNNIIALVSPQILPSPFMIDDGTSRFIQISPQIVIGHSGLSSDGRILANSAQRLVVEHSYTYDEPIPIELFLEEMSLLYQQYTMKPGSRPFGSTLLVAYMPQSTTGNNEKPQLFRIDPSGSVIVYEDNYAIINGKSLSNNNNNNNIESKIKQLILSSKQKENDSNNDNDVDDDNTKNKKYRKELSQILQEAIKSNNNELSSSSSNSKQQQESSTTDGTDTRMKIPLKTRIISATLSKTSGFVVERN